VLAAATLWLTPTGCIAAAKIQAAELLTESPALLCVVESPALSRGLNPCWLSLTFS
jgi:hypothetical protein